MRDPVRQRPQSFRTGFSMIEILIALTLAAILATSAALAASEGYQAYRSTRRTNSVEAKVRHALDKAARELLSSGLDVLAPQNIDDDFGTSNLVFQQATGIAAENITWGSVMRLAFEYEAGEVDDGGDNNGNGLADEGVLVWTRNDGAANETRTVLCHNVREFLEGETDNNADDNANGITDEAGFNIHRSGDVLTLRLTIEEPSDRAASVVRTLTTSVRLRN